jgi:hypothetical protein
MKPYTAALYIQKDTENMFAMILDYLAVPSQLFCQQGGVDTVSTYP